MQQSLTYKTSFLKDSYLIFKNNIQIGKLYKKEWLGSPIETTINERHFKFVSKGFLRLTISIIDKDSKQIIGIARGGGIFSFLPTATLCLAGNIKYSWAAKSIFSSDWTWSELSTHKTVASSAEPLDIFRQKGKISLTQESQQQELLIALGIHLRNVLQHRNMVLRICCGIVVVLSLTNFFA